MYVCMCVYGIFIPFYVCVIHMSVLSLCVYDCSLRSMYVAALSLSLSPSTITVNLFCVCMFIHLLHVCMYNDSIAHTSV